jgi:hypothetical protein
LATSCVGAALGNTLLEERWRERSEDGNTRKRPKKLLDDLMKKRGYWKLEEEALELALEAAMDPS